ncbi:hypothetical protein GGI43DRAFT_14546 [Trichoderma evansii]
MATVMVVVMATAMANNRSLWRHGCIQKGLDALIWRPISCIPSHPISRVPTLAHAVTLTLDETQAAHTLTLAYLTTLPSHPSTHSPTSTYHTRYTYIHTVAQAILAHPCTYHCYCYCCCCCCCYLLYAWHCPRPDDAACIHRIASPKSAGSYYLCSVHFTYMLLAHVMQSSLTGSLLRSGTALVDSRQHPSIDRRGHAEALLHVKTRPSVERAVAFCIAFPKTRPPSARLFAKRERKSFPWS